MRVKIKKLPGCAYGGQIGYGLDLNRHGVQFNDENSEKHEVASTLPVADKELANIEAEKGETALGDFDQDGQLEHMKIAGKRHSQGGTPLTVPKGTFIFSDTQKMKLGGAILESFGKSATTKKKYTPADLAKQYDINKYKAILDDPYADPLKKRTAELMIQNNERKLADLAMVQEAKKGFPQGIPSVAEKYYGQPQPGMEEEQGTIMRFGGMAYAKDGKEVEYNGKKYRKLDKLDSDKWKEVAKVDNRTYYEIPGQSGQVPGDPMIVPPANRGRIDPDAWKIAVEKYAPQGATLDDLAKQSYLSDVNNPEVQNYWKKFYKQRPGSSYEVNPDYAYMETDIPQQIGVQARVPQSRQPSNYKGPTPGSAQGQSSKVPFGWTAPDKMAMMNSLSNLAGVKKYTPWEPALNLATPETIYYDPARELAANSEQAAIAAQANMQLAGPGSRFRNTEVMGQAATNAANTIGKYANMNVGVGNQASAMNAEITNKQITGNYERSKRLYDGNTVANQQYDNAQREARGSVVKQYAQGWNNAATMYNMSVSESPYYAVNPETGTIYFHSPKSMDAFINSKSGTGPTEISDEEYIQTLIASGKYNTDQAIRMAQLRKHGRDKITRTTKSGNSKETSTDYIDD